MHRRLLRVGVCNGNVAPAIRAKDILAKEGWDPQYGARPLKRAIQRHLEDPLARKVLGGEFPAGTKVVVDQGPTPEVLARADASVWAGAEAVDRAE